METLLYSFSIMLIINVLLLKFSVNKDKKATEPKKSKLLDIKKNMGHTIVKDTNANTGLHSKLIINKIDMHQIKIKKRSIKSRKDKAAVV